MTPAGVISAYCQFNLRLFPFDSQRCRMRVESWKTNIGHQIFKSYNSGFSVWNLTESEEFLLVYLEKIWQNDIEKVPAK